MYSEFEPSDLVRIFAIKSEFIITWSVSLFTFSTILKAENTNIQQFNTEY